MSSRQLHTATSHAGLTRCSAEPINVAPRDVDALMAELTDAARLRPLVIVTPAGGSAGPRVDVAALTAATEGIADIRVLASQSAVWRLSQVLPTDLHVYGGAIRLYWPDLQLTDPSARHPRVLIFGDDQHASDTAIERINAELAARADTYLPSSPPAEPARATRATKLRQVHRDLSTVRQALAVAEQRAVTAEKDVERLQAQVAAARAELAAATQPDDPVYADPEDQLRHDLQLAWLHAIPENDRDAAPLRPYRLGPDLIDSLNVGVAPQARILRVMVDVITGVVHTYPGRQAHRQRTSSSGSAPPLVRGDGAVGWRCAIKTNSPAAGRLLWWQLPDGPVELARLIRHE